MKKLATKLLMMILSLIILLSITGCEGRNSKTFEPDLSDLPKINGVDVEEEIETFEEDAFNVIDIKSGDKKKLDKADVLLTHGGNCYTSDNSVATVSDKGVVKAKEKGACYILIVDNFAGQVHVEVYKIMVDAPKKITFAEVMFYVVPVLMVVMIIAIIIANRSHKPQKPGFAAPQNTPPMYNGYGDPNANNVNHVNATPNNVAKHCPHCGQQADGAFCPYCGGKLN